MKILVFGGGLGNQLFGYAFTNYIRSRFPEQKVYGVYNKKMLSEHYGLELERWFEVDLPPSRWWVSALTGSLYAIKKITGWKGLLDLDQNVMQKENALVYFAQHTDKRYIPDGEWIKFKVDDNNLNDDNKRVLEEIRNSNSVFVHVRRGDYLSPKYKATFEGCCTLDYYKEAIELVKEKVENPKFFVFSNDIEWSKENLPLENPTFIDWNTGINSPLDLYLMSNCKHAILANSTFSLWGVYLGKGKQIVTHPKKWINPPFVKGDLFKDEWFEL